MLRTDKSLTDLVTLHPVVNPPQLFNAFIRTCSIIKSLERSAKYEVTHTSTNCMVSVVNKICVNSGVIVSQFQHFFGRCKRALLA